jgi:hypothetical protein
MYKQVDWKLFTVIATTVTLNISICTVIWRQGDFSIIVLIVMNSWNCFTVIVAAVAAAAAAAVLQQYLL